MKKVILGLVAGFLMSANALAETIAVVNVQKVATEIPQTLAMQQALMAEFSVPTEEIKKLESDIKFNLEKFQRESMTMSPEQKTALENTIKEQQKAYQEKVQPLEQQMRRRQAEERNKIFALIQQAVSAVAAEEKIDIVLDAKSIAFVTPEKDISDKVVEKVTKLN